MAPGNTVLPITIDGVSVEPEHRYDGTGLVQRHLDLWRLYIRDKRLPVQSDRFGDRDDQVQIKHHSRAHQPVLHRRWPPWRYAASTALLAVVDAAPEHGQLVSDDADGTGIGRVVVSQDSIQNAAIRAVEIGKKHDGQAWLNVRTKK